MLIYEYLLTAS